MVVGPEFDFGEDAQLTGFDHLGGVAESELRALRAIFNLDFLPDAELGGDLEGEPPTPVLAPGPGGASQAKDMIAVYQRLKQKYQT